MQLQLQLGLLPIVVVRRFQLLRLQHHLYTYILRSMQDVKLYSVLLVELHLMGYLKRQHMNLHQLRLELRQVRLLIHLLHLMVDLLRYQLLHHYS